MSSFREWSRNRVRELTASTNVFNLPNLLTLMRIALIPFLAVLLDYDGPQLPLDRDSMLHFSPGKVAALVVALAGLTDLLDGYFARKWHIESLLGKFLDPVADKLLLLVGLVMLMKLGRVPEWLVMVLLSREFLITGLRGVAAGEGLIIAAGNSGKWKLTFQMIGLALLMWYGSFFGISAGWIGILILYLALVVSLFSGFRYLSDFFTALNAKRSVMVVPPSAAENRESTPARRS